MKPALVDMLDHASATYVSPYGQIESSWKKEGGIFTWSVKVPGNTVALVYVPASAVSDITESGEHGTRAQAVFYRGEEGGYVVFEIGSGTYQFSAKGKAL